MYQFSFLIPLFLYSSFLFANSLQLPEDYQDLSFQDKESLLWANISEVPYEKLPSLGSIPGYKKFLGLINLLPTFDRVSDEMPCFRQKFIHPFGVAAKIRFEADPSTPYTGIFKGADGLARLSLAGNPSAINFTPGMALKFFISHQPSVNIQVMNSVNGQKGDNFFAQDFSNVIPPAEGALKVLEYWFKIFVRPANMLGVDHFAQYTQEGLKEENPSYPQQIILKPSAMAYNLYAENPSNSDFRLKLMSLPTEMVLYEVYGKSSIEDNSPLIYLGKIVLKSSFVASQYGDEKLFFQHQRWP